MSISLAGCLPLVPARGQPAVNDPTRNGCQHQNAQLRRYVAKRGQGCQGDAQDT